MAKKPKVQARKSNGNSNTSKSTPVRNSPIPRGVVKKNNAPANRAITHAMITERAYLISISGNGGSQDENWFRAERELRGGL